MRFVRRRGAIEARLDPAEAGLLHAVALDLGELLAPEADDEPAQDPLAAMVGLPTGPVAAPEDPALARLLPDAYGDDASAAADFRRYTEADLRAGKSASAAIVAASLEPLLESGGRLRLDLAQSEAWLATLNDVRLVLGTRLEVTEDSMEELELDPQDPTSAALGVYGWLGWLQESLLHALPAPSPDPTR